MYHRLISLLLLLSLAACNLPLVTTPQPPSITLPVKPTRQEQPNLPALPQTTRPTNPQIGLNFIRYYWSDTPNTLDTTTPYLQPADIFEDFRSLKVQAYRQFVNADLFWDVVEPQDNQWNFAQADAVIPNTEFEPLVSLFRMQYASPTPPWANDPAQFQKTMGVEATDYLTTVVQRYAPYVTYWEIGNEMAFWRAADVGGKAQPDSTASSLHGEEALPAAYPLDGFSPQEQGIFLAQAAAIIRQNDPDAVIVMPGLPALGDYATETWLPGVLQTAGTDWFDIVNYHDYSGWERYTLMRPKFEQQLVALGIADKPVWCTETGSSSSEKLTIRTNYPNSAETQAADIFRRVVQAWGHGDALVVWHTYINSSDVGGNWAAYGIKNRKNEAQASYYTFQLLTSELIPFSSVEKLAADGRGINAYRIHTTDGVAKYVLWGQGNYTLPAYVSQLTSVIPNADGSFHWQSISPGQNIELSAYPVLVR